MANIFNSLDYKEILKKTLLSRKAALGKAYSFEALAEACRIQKTYLSRVLGHKGNLNRDQLYRASQFLKLNNSERDYLFLTYDWEQTTIPELRNQLYGRIESLRKEQIQTEKNLPLKTQESESAGMESYYMDPLFSIIHMFLTVKRFAQNPSLMLSVLNLRKEDLSTYLEKLESLGVIKFENNQWLILKDNIHLSKTADLQKAYRTLMRLKSLEKMDRSPDNDFYSFSVAFSTDPKVKQKIHERFLDFLKETQEMVSQGQETEVYQMNFDLLKWS